ncbi:MAG: SseB family protein [Arthrobacter sp.]|nr:SseB family protein [Arthrobacter sp.]
MQVHATVTCAFTPAAREATVRLLWRAEPVDSIDSGWRVGVPGEQLAPQPAGTSWCAWPEALQREPVLALVGGAAVGARFAVHREAGRALEVRDGRSGALVPWPERAASAAGAPLGIGPGELEHETLAERVLPALLAAQRRPGEAVLAALWGCSLWVPTVRATGAPVISDGVAVAFASTGAADAWQAGRGVGEPAAPLDMLPFARLVALASPLAARLTVDPGAASQLGLDLAALVPGAASVDSEALMVLRAKDADRLERMLITPGRVWIGLRDAADPSGPPLRVRDHRTGASVLPVFASEADALSYDDLAEPTHFRLDRLAAAWEPETGVLLGLGSTEEPVEVGWGRLRAAGFVAAPGARAWAAPAPTASEPVPEPARVGPVPWPGVPDAYSEAFAPAEREIIEAVLELPRIPVDAAWVLVSPRADGVVVAVAYAVDGVAHSAAHVAGGGTGGARVALLRWRVMEAVAGLARSLRSQGRPLPSQLRFQALPGGAGGAVMHDDAGGPEGIALAEWVARQGLERDRCLDEQAVLTADAGHVSLERAVEAGDERAAARAVAAGAALWVAEDRGGSPLRLRDAQGRVALAVFTSQESLAVFAPAASVRRAWTAELASGLGESRWLVVDAGGPALVLDRELITWPANAHMNAHVHAHGG